MRLLITGGAGFIGSNFTRYILEEYPDYQVSVVDLLTYAGDKQRLADIEARITFHQADIADYDAVEKLTKDIDTVVHFAAETHVDRSIADPGPFLKTNILGTEALARAAIKNNIKRFHHVSTDEVFGSLEIGGANKFNEKTPYDPRSPYAASKAASDHVVRSYGETFGLPYTITNCSNNYGPADSPGRIIPVFIANALDDKPLPIYGNGQAVRDYLYVYDHCTAIDLAIHKGDVGGTYCVGGGAQRNSMQVAEAILKALNKPADLIDYVQDRPGHDMRYDIDPTHIEQSLGWKQSVSFEEGLQKTIDWYKANNEWRRSFTKSMDLMRGQGLYATKEKA